LPGSDGNSPILQAELTERELSAANLRAELAAFEGRYLREVGILMPNSTTGMRKSPNL